MRSEGLCEDVDAEIQLDESESLELNVKLSVRQECRLVQRRSSWEKHDWILQALRERIRDAYEARWKAEKHFNEEGILQELPTSLRIEVYSDNNDNGLLGPTVIHSSLMPRQCRFL